MEPGLGKGPDMSADRDRPQNAALEELFVRYWDNALQPVALRQLNHILASDEEARVLFQKFCLQTLSIGEHFAVADVSAVPDQMPSAKRSASKTRARVAQTAVVALVVVAAITFWRFGRTAVDSGAPSDPVGFAWLEDFTGRVRVSGDDGNDTLARPKQSLRSGQIVTVAGHDGTAEVRFRDGSRLVLNGETTVQVIEDDHKTVRVHHGNLAADVRPQPPGRPMILTTQDAEVKVLGTKLSISEAKHKTEIAVVQGEVRVTRLSDRESLDLHSGQMATAIKGSQKLLLARLSELPDTYTLDFEQLPTDWRAGELIQAGLPPGSRAGMRATPYHSDEFGIQYQIRSHNAWTAGLFALHEDSWLHQRFRAERPGFFHVLLVARSDDPTNKRGVVFEAPQFWNRRQPDTWYEVSVPLGNAKRLGNSPPNFPLPLVVYQLIVNSHLDDVGVVVDRLQVNRSPTPD
jgi:ferric-dicitrate binding protein FerR (iron transport regulator)